jgi:hypothetical protein
MLRTNGSAAAGQIPPDLARVPFSGELRSVAGDLRRSADEGSADCQHSVRARRLAPFAADDADAEPHPPSGRMPLTSGCSAMLTQFGTNGGFLPRRSVIVRDSRPPVGHAMTGRSASTLLSRLNDTPAEYERPRECPVHRGSASQNSQFGRCRIRERPVISPARSAGFGGSVPVHDRHGHLRARPDARMGSIGTLKRRLAHGWVSDWSSLRAWVVWVRV